MRLKNCEICQKKFELSKYNPYQLYCSKICNSKAYYHRNLIEIKKRNLSPEKKEYKKNWVKKNSSKVQVYIKKGNQKQKEKYKSDPVFRRKLLDKKRDYRNNNPEFKAKIYLKDNEKKRERYKTDEKFRKNTIDRTSKRIIERFNTDLNYRLRMLLRGRIRSVMKTKNAKKNSQIYKLLGCSLEYFKKHMENQFSSGMSWSNIGKWHIDHIYPLSKFDLTKLEEQKKAFHYSNMQPLWAKDNLQKSAKVNFINNQDI